MLSRLKLRALRGKTALFLALLAGFLLLQAPDDAQARRYASIVIDADTGQVLHSENPDRQAYPASLTKMMTLYLAFEALSNGTLTLDQALPVSSRAAAMPPSKLGLVAGSTIRVEDIILALVTKSANDAAVVMAEALAGSESAFATMMTERARELGMLNTVFRNASGLPNDAQLSTARDMARLGRALYQDYPSYYSYFATASFTYAGRTYSNHNALLDDYEGTDGIKTGYIRASGYNLVASAVRDGRRIIAVVFGGRTSASRNAHMITLLDRGFAAISNMGIAGLPLPNPANPFRGSEVQVATTTAPPAPAIPATIPAAAPTTLPNPLADDPLGSILAGLDRGAMAQGDADPVDDQSLAAISPSWGIQVGAFSRFAPAHLAATEAVQLAPAHLMDSHVTVMETSGDTGLLYRARLDGLSEDTARAACETLESQRRDCVVVPPSS